MSDAYNNLNRRISDLQAQVARLNARVIHSPVWTPSSNQRRQFLVRIGNGNTVGTFTDWPSGTTTTIYGLVPGVVSTVPTLTPTTTPGAAPDGLSVGYLYNEDDALVGNVWVAQAVHTSFYAASYDIYGIFPQGTPVICMRTFAIPLDGDPTQSALVYLPSRV